MWYCRKCKNISLSIYKLYYRTVCRGGQIVFRKYIYERDSVISPTDNMFLDCGCVNKKEDIVRIYFRLFNKCYEDFIMEIKNKDSKYHINQLYSEWENVTYDYRLDITKEEYHIIQKEIGVLRNKLLSVDILNNL